MNELDEIPKNEIVMFRQNRMQCRVSDEINDLIDANFESITGLTEPAETDREFFESLVSQSVKLANKNGYPELKNKVSEISAELSRLQDIEIKYNEVSEKYEAALSDIENLKVEASRLQRIADDTDSVSGENNDLLEQIALLQSELTDYDLLNNSLRQQAIDKYLTSKFAESHNRHAAQTKALVRTTDRKSSANYLNALWNMSASFLTERKLISVERLKQIFDNEKQTAL